MSKKKHINIKDHLNDNSLDLSLCDLQEVPVKEIASVSLAIDIDLSSNKLSVLGDNFASALFRLVKLDLSGNQLSQLPENFGLLVNLRHLDLYKNKLETLPPSFANLRSLRWLDLKENPLSVHLAQVTGSCLDHAECVAAARNVIKHVRLVQRELEEKDRRTEQLRQQKLLEDEQNQLKRELKQKRKKIRKIAAKDAENAKAGENGVAVVEEPVDRQPAPREYSAPAPSFTENVRWAFWSLLKIILLASILVALVLVGVRLVDKQLYQSWADRALGVLPSYVRQTAAATAFATLTVGSSTLFLLLHSAQVLADCCQLLSTSEFLAAHFRAAQDHLNLGFGKSSDLLTNYSQQLVALVQSYVQ